MFGLHKQVKGQPAAGQQVWQQAVFQKVRALHV